MNVFVCHTGLGGLPRVLIRGHPDLVPTKVGDHFKGWGPVFTGNPEFRLEFTPLQNRAVMTSFFKSGNL